MKCLLYFWVLCLTCSVPGWTQTAPGVDTSQGAPAGAAIQSSPFPIEIAGYLSFQMLRSDDLAQSFSYRDYSGSLFLSKTLGRWRFHAELNAGNAA